jgi:hypothetical protein
MRTVIATAEFDRQLVAASTTTKAPDRASNVARARPGQFQLDGGPMVSPIFQPRFGEDIYPIGRFILHRARALSMNRSNLARQLGYRDSRSGHEALSAVLLTGSVVPQLASHLAGALEAEDAVVGAVIDATARQKRDEARLDRTLWKLQDAMSGKKRRLRVENERAYLTSFRPHIQVRTARAVPSPIFVAALLTVALLRIVHLPDEVLTANDEARDGIIKTIIMDHWRENDGRVPAFGGITGYVLVLVAGYGVFDFGLPYSVTGDRSGAMQKVERLGEATLGTRRGDTRLTGLLKASPIHGIPAGRG